MTRYSPFVAKATSMSPPAREQRPDPFGHGSCLIEFIGRDYAELETP